MKTDNKYSYLTAIERNKLSFPMSWLQKQNFLKGKILDFGCGFGSDVDFLKKDKFEISAYDNYYFKDFPKTKFDTITCIYVLNVIDDFEQSEVLMSVSELLNQGGKAYFAVRRDIKREGYRNHYVHKKPTYQTNVKLPFKSILQTKSVEIYEYQHYNLANNNKNTCVFCSPENTIIYETANTYAILDNYPVTKGHTLIIPKRHVASYFDLTLKEQVSCQLVINRLKKRISSKLNPDGFNIGINVGKTAGQTINHVHIHLIPRYKGDCQDPTGGVRGVISEKQKY